MLHKFGTCNINNKFVIILYSLYKKFLNFLNTTKTFRILFFISSELSIYYYNVISNNLIIIK